MGVPAMHDTHNKSLLRQDPVTGRPATLIKRYNISQQKELELQLASQQVALQR